jgi:ribosomal protein S18 acetylase RimI-like enzyme
MNIGPTICMNRADRVELEAHLIHCDNNFVPPLSDRVDIQHYAEKLMDKSVRFEAWHGEKLIGLVAAYCNDPTKLTAFITNVSVLPAWQGHGIAAHLLANCLEHVRQLGFGALKLEVDSRNQAAVGLYRKHGFATAHANEHSLKLILTLERTKP